MDNSQMIRGIVIGVVATIAVVMVFAMFCPDQNNACLPYPADLMGTLPTFTQPPVYTQPVYNQQPIYNQQPAYNQPAMNYAQQPVHNQQIAFRPRMAGQQCLPGTQLVAMTNSTGQAGHQIPSVGMEVAAASNGGVQVTRVYAGSHADRGGVRPGDIIVSVSGTKVPGLQAFFIAIKAAEIELAATIGVVRSGRIMNLSVMIGQSEMDAVTMPRNPAAPY
jgi:PDZ domain